MMRPDVLAVIGLGPVGGSLAWSAVRAGVPRVVGFSRERGDAVQALTTGAVHELADRPESALRGADLVVVALPGDRGELLGRLAPHLAPHAFLTSVVDIVRPIAAAAVSAGLSTRWAASHPLQSVPGEGFAAARPEPFRGAVVHVTPVDPSGDPAVREVMHFWDDLLGAESVRMALEEHDVRVAWMEQLPRLLGVAVAEVYGAHGLGAVTWGSEARRVTDLAAHDTANLADALISNRAAVSEAIAATTGALGALATAIAAGDQERVVALLEAARRIRRGSER